MGNLESVRMLLRVSVKIDSRNEISKTPMHLAAENGHVPLALSLSFSFARVFFPSYTFIITLHFTHSLLIHLLTHTYIQTHTQSGERADAIPGRHNSGRGRRRQFSSPSRLHQRTCGCGQGPHCRKLRCRGSVSQPNILTGSHKKILWLGM